VISTPAQDPPDVPRLSFHALITAFCSEVLADLLVARLLFPMFAGDQLVPDMDEKALTAVVRTVYESTTYLPIMFMFGTLTTVAGAYLAARLARRIPYYHGLAMGIIGVAFGLFLWSDAPIWLDYLGLVLTIPFSLLGAHLARKRMQELEIL
jgi:hypothetical protein